MLTVDTFEDLCVSQNDPEPNEIDRTLIQTDAPRAVSDSYSRFPTIPGYTIVKELGRGAMGVVYEGIQDRLNRPVALKMVLSGSYASAMDVARFMSEAEAIAEISHANVVRVYEFGEVENRPYYAMERLTGGTLALRLRTNGPMTPEAAARLLIPLANGIQSAHELGIVHRDLKPDNVLFDASDTPKIADFGLAKRATSDLTATGALMGTPAYMAPEQAAGQTRFVGPSVDVYALGVILFECLTGRVPFKSDNIMSLLNLIRETDAPSVREFSSNIPKDMNSIVQKCLAKHPQERYPNAAALAGDLERFLMGQTPLAANRTAFGGVWATLDRGRYSSEFAAYSTMFLWLAAIMVTADVTMGLFLNRIVHPYVGAGASVARMAFVPLFVWLYTGRKSFDGSPNSRFLLSLWGGHLIACMMMGIAGVLEHRQVAFVEPVIYRYFSLATGIAFVALGPNYWGWCYAFGAAFLLSPVILVDYPFALPFVFAAIWGVALVCVSRHLKRLARQSAATVSNAVVKATSV